MLLFLYILYFVTVCSQRVSIKIIEDTSTSSQSSSSSSYGNSYSSSSGSSSSTSAAVTLHRAPHTASEPPQSLIGKLNNLFERYLCVLIS